MTKFRKKVSLLLIVLLVTVFLAPACSGSSGNDLVGEFTTEEGGRAEIKITKEKDNYYLSIYEHDEWSKPQELEAVKEEIYIELFGEDWKSCVKDGLYSGVFGIFKVEKGCEIKGHTFTTGYFVRFYGGVEVYKL